MWPSRMEWRENRTSFMLCALSGLFGGVIFRQDWMGIFAWIALVPYFVALSRFRTPKSIVWGTYIFGFIWYYLGLWWLHTLTVFSLLIPLAVPALTLIEATYFLAFAFPANFAMRRLPPWAVPWVIALMWPGMEYMRTWTDLAFPWNYMGHSQANFGLVVQFAEAGGVYLVSALVCFLQSAVCLDVFRNPRRRFNVWSTIAIIIVVLILVEAPQQFVLAHREHGPRPFASHCSVAVIQPGIPQTKKWDAIMGVPGEDAKQYQERFNRTDQEMRKQALDLVKQASAKQPQLYILPETSFLSPFFIYQTDLHRDLRKLAIELNADLFFGADNRVPLTTYFDMSRNSVKETTPTLPLMPLRVNDQGVTVPDWAKEPQMANFNSAWLLTPKDGLQPAAYNKLQLVPFGEMVPVVGHFEWFQKLAIAGSFYPGVDAPTFETHGIKFGSVICFESAFSSLTSAFARNGAQMLVVLTNDAWYDPKYLIEKGGFWGTLFNLPVLRGLAAAGPDQHFAQSIFRAVETRLPVLRAANTGISAVIAPSGEVTQRLDYSSSGQFTANVPIPRQHISTFYARYGDWFAWLGLVTLTSVLGWMVLELLRARRPGSEKG